MPLHLEPHWWADSRDDVGIDEWGPSLWVGTSLARCQTLKHSFHTTKLKMDFDYTLLVIQSLFPASWTCLPGQKWKRSSPSFSEHSEKLGAGPVVGTGATPGFCSNPTACSHLLHRGFRWRRRAQLLWLHACNQELPFLLYMIQTLGGEGHPSDGEWVLGYATNSSQLLRRNRCWTSNLVCCESHQYPQFHAFHINVLPPLYRTETKKESYGK